MTLPAHGSVTVDHEDLRIIRALLVSPRIGFAAIAKALAVSEPSVARRYRRLVESGVLRVVGTVDTGALGQSRWIVRARSRPGGASALADALAQHPDVGWVSLSAAGSEVVCVVRARTDGGRDDLLGDRLPRTPVVLGTQASVMLHQFMGGRGRWWTALAGVLSPEEEAGLGSAGNPFPRAPVVADRPVRPDAEDLAILDALAEDGRATAADLARRTRSTVWKVSHRMEALAAAGVLSSTVELAATALGFRATANIWLQVEPARLDAVGRDLSVLPEVGFAAAISGPENLLVAVHCRDLAALYGFVSDRLGAVAGVRSAEVVPVFRQVKQLRTRVGPDGLLVRPAARTARVSRAR